MALELIKAGADIYQLDSTGMNVATYAIKHANFQLLTTVLSISEENKKDFGLEKALIFSIKNESYNFFLMLLDEKYSFDHHANAIHNALQKTKDKCPAEIQIKIIEKLTSQNNLALDPKKLLTSAVDLGLDSTVLFKHIMSEHPDLLHESIENEQLIEYLLKHKNSASIENILITLSSTFDIEITENTMDIILANPGLSKLYLSEFIKNGGPLYDPQGKLKLPQIGEMKNEESSFYDRTINLYENLHRDVMKKIQADKKTL